MVPVEVVAQLAPVMVLLASATQATLAVPV